MIFNPKKSVFNPSRKITYLGFNINLAKRTIALTPAMKERLKSALGYAAEPAGLVNFITTSLGLPAFWTQLA